MQIPIIFFVMILVILVLFLNSKREQLTVALPDSNDPCKVKEYNIHAMCWPYYAGNLCEKDIEEYSKDCGEFTPF